MIKRICKENFDSTHLYNEMSKIEYETSLKLLSGLKWINDNADAVVIGGTAVCHYLEGRALTPDIDLVCADIEQVKGILVRDNLKYTELASTFGKPFGIHIPSFEIDILDSSSGNRELNEYIIKSEYKNSLIAGYKMKIASPEALCIMKFQTGRFKDEMDAFGLLQSGVLKRKTYVKTISALFRALNEAEILEKYAGLIK